MTRVVDELAIEKEVRVIEAAPAPAPGVITSTPTVVVPTTPR